MKIFALLTFLAIVEVWSSSMELTEVNKNKANEDILLRNKRFLVFTPNGGTLKFVAGYLGPIDIPSYQNINCLRNIQFQYNLPTTWVTQDPSFPNFPVRGRSFSEKPKAKYVPDSSRKIAYEVVEATLDREGKNGRECLLRTICEVAETPVHHNGLVGELLQLFFTPGKHETLNRDYDDARKAGLNRVNCEKMYPDCPFGHGILDSVSMIQNFKFENWLNF